MTSGDVQEPWEDLERLVDDQDVDGAAELLERLPANETARAVARLDDADQRSLLSALAPPDAAELVEDLPDRQAADLIEQLEPASAAAIVHELSSEEQADLIAAIAPSEAREILDALEPAEARGLRELAAYAPDVAGGLMATEFLTYPEDATVAAVVEDLRRRADEFEDEDIQYVYVVSASSAIRGVLRIRDLLFAPGARPVQSVMIVDPVAVGPETPLSELEARFDRHAYLGLPVVDDQRRILGVVLRAAVEEAVGQRSRATLLRSQGIIGGEELRTMPTGMRALRRLSWLTPNIVLNVLAASVIAFYTETIEAVVALAFFLPIISDMSGCSGSQAIAVSIRELSRGLVRPSELRYVWLKEVRVGLLNGLVLGLVIAVVAYLWQGNAHLGLVVGGALALNTVVAVSIGGLVPLVLRRLGQDPALASGPLLTTVTDMCGFFLVLSFATALLPSLI